ncbi:unnamed protein product [Staurois parvus]|uniref:Uncharacterized protein n=1 Tax=Staurois parvus TaxID=386267 RepID=A0ABN9EUF1_9NEOB|nr:unnamed protein product [Staurois parvus]
MIRHSREHISTALESNGTSIALGDFPSCYHFVILPLTVDCEIFSSKEI